MITYQDVLHAQQNISDFVKKTPLVEFGNGIYLKLENTHDKVNAFKIRGAYNKMKTLGADCGEVITAAVGSYGFAVGVIGKKLGIKTTCFMPETATDEKKQKMASLVDEIKFAGTEFSETEKAALRYAEEKQLPFLHPYNDETVIAGQGTMGLEILEDLPEVKNIYLPMGGGGMLSGVAIGIKHLKPDVRIVGVQPLVMAAMISSVKEGKIIVVERQKSLAEPLTVNLNPKAITFEYVKNNADDFILVTEEEMASAMRKIYEKTGYKVEGAGAIALAAALKDKKREGTSVCIVSGGNISEERFDEITK